MIIKVTVCLRNKENPALTCNQRPWLSWSSLGETWGWSNLECVLRGGGISVLARCCPEVSLVLRAGAVTRGLQFQYELFCSKFSLLLCYFLTCVCPCKALQMGFVASVILVSSSAKTFGAFLSTGPLHRHRLIPGSWISSVWWPLSSLGEGKMWPAGRFV